MKSCKRPEKFTILKMFGHLMGKFYLRMDQEIQVYFMINPDLVGNGQGLHSGKRNTFNFFVYFRVHVGLCLIKELEGLSFIFTC